MPYGRTHESEADIVGQDLMAKSGFDPSAAISLWQNMANFQTVHHQSLCLPIHQIKRVLTS
jgi:predicted Zn-dependent protease